MKNVATFGKLIGLLFFCLPLLFLLSINMYTKTKRTELTRLGMGTIFLVGERAKRARRYLFMSMESRDIYYYNKYNNKYVRLFLIPMRMTYVYF